MANFISLTYWNPVKETYSEPIIINSASITHITPDNIYLNNGDFFRNAWQMINILEAMLDTSKNVYLIEKIPDTGYVVHKDCPC